MPARARIMLAMLLLVAGCSQPPEEHQARIAAFGTLVEIRLRAPEAAARRATAAIDGEFQTLHHRWHAWEPGPLGEINRAIAADRPVEVPAAMIEPIERARELENASQGLFNPTIGGLLALWGFHASELPEGPPPSAERIMHWINRQPSLEDLEIENGILRSSNRAVQLDFNAFIKGHAVDRAIEILAEHGIEHAVVNAGGDLRVRGRHGDRPWRAAVRHPGSDGGQILARLTVHDGEAVFTSGNYLRYRADEGLRHGHILDPRSGYPADHVSSVTVIHEDGATADAAATALAVAGPEEWPGIARRLGVEHVMRVDAEGAVWMTPAMDRRSEFSTPSTRRIVSLPSGS